MPRAYRTYTPEERLEILATAISEGLSATDVHKRFGVKPVTYYLWRRKGGLKSVHGRRSSTQGDASRTENTPGQESRKLAIVDPGAS